MTTVSQSFGIVTQKVELTKIADNLKIASFVTACHISKKLLYRRLVFVSELLICQNGRPFQNTTESFKKYFCQKFSVLLIRTDFKSTN